MTVSIDELRVADDPEAWRRAGFTVDDDGTCRIGAVRVRCTGEVEGRRGLRSWVLRGLPDKSLEVSEAHDADDGVSPDDPTEPADLRAHHIDEVEGWGTVDGLVTGRSEEGACEPAHHANGALAIDHLVLISPDGERTATALGTLGLEVRRVRDDSERYQVPMRQTFFRAGDVILELIAPQDPDPGDTRPARFFGLALAVDDLDSLPARYGEHLGPVTDAVQPGRRIATLRHRALGLSCAVAFMSLGEPPPG